MLEESSTREVERDLDETRKDLDQTLSQLEKKLTFNHLKEQTRQRVSKLIDSARLTMREHPVAFGVAGAGIVLLVLYRRSQMQPGNWRIARESWRNLLREVGRDLDQRTGSVAQQAAFLADRSGRAYKRLQTASR